MQSEPLPETQNVPPVTRCEIAAWILIAALLLAALLFKLLAALLGGLLVRALIHALSGHLSDRKLISHTRSKSAAALMLGLAATVLATVTVFALIGVMKGRLGDFPQLMQKVAEVVARVREKLPASLQDKIPDDADDVKELISTKLHENAQELKHMGAETIRIALHALIGIVAGVLISFESQVPKGPLGTAFFERVRRLALAFERVVFAQVKISAINTALTAIYLLVILPILGIHLPFRGTLVAVTFIAGLLPVVGNLISNALIFVMSIEISIGVAVGSLIYLVVIHKLEYFLNAKIIGGQINSAAWEIMIVMLLFESIFGIPGVILAPIAYAYLKSEMQDRKLI